MHLNLIRLFAFAACVLAGALAIRFCEGNRRGRRPLAAAITVIYLTALCCDTLFSRTELAEAAEIGAHSAGAGAAREESPLLLCVLQSIFAMHLYDFRTAFFFNILLFLPLGYLVRYVFSGWKFRHCVFAGALSSLLIESLQGLTPLTINREGFPADGSSTGRSRRSCTSPVSERTFLAQRKPRRRSSSTLPRRCIGFPPFSRSCRSGFRIWWKFQNYDNGALRREPEREPGQGAFSFDRMWYDHAVTVWRRRKRDAGSAPVHRSRQRKTIRDQRIRNREQRRKHRAQRTAHFRQTQRRSLEGTGRGDINDSRRTGKAIDQKRAAAAPCDSGRALALCPSLGALCPCLRRCAGGSRRRLCKAH